jgi:hypothetical protein
MCIAPADRSHSCVSVTDGSSRPARTEPKIHGGQVIIMDGFAEANIDLSAESGSDRQLAAARFASMPSQEFLVC